MATDKTTVSFNLDQLAAAGDVSAKPMFGEHGLYRDGRMFGLICDGQLFIKPTPGGRAFAGDIEEGSPYPGAKPHLLINADRWNDGEWLAELVRITTAELPPAQTEGAAKAESGLIPRMTTLPQRSVALPPRLAATFAPERSHLR